MKIRKFLGHSDNCSSVTKNYRLEVRKRKKKELVLLKTKYVPKVIFRCEKETRDKSTFVITVTRDLHRFVFENHQTTDQSVFN